MKKYTKQEMVDRGGCGNDLVVVCERQCPFEQIFPRISHHDCYENGVKKYMETKDPLTYKSLALAINHEIKICHKNMPAHEWIIYCPTQEFWKDNNAIIYSPVFSDLSGWSHWVEPKKEFKPYSLNIWLPTDMPCADARYVSFANRLLGCLEDFTWQKDVLTSHKFKITVEKAED